MEKFITERLILVLGIFFFILTTLPILAPVFAYYKLEFLADIIYWPYQWICHQRPWRSYHLFDYQLAMDARMMFMFAGISVGSFLTYFGKIKPLSYKNAIILALIFTLPLALDGTIQFIAEVLNINNSQGLPFYESTNFIRSLTGAFFGAGAAVSLSSILNWQRESIQTFISGLKFGFLIFFLTIPFIIGLTFLSYSTSVKYRPETPFADTIQRFPGYNYEITVEGGHSTIERFMVTSPEKYINRAKKFGKEELLKQYYKDDL